MDKKRLIDYDVAYMKMALAMSELSYATRNKVGCIIVSDDGQVISQGYNGTPAGTDNTCETIECTCNWRYGCVKLSKAPEIVKNLDLCENCQYAKLITKKEVLHAESNAITKCAKYRSSTVNSTLYVTLSPCIDCAKLIIQAGIKRVVYLDEYRIVDGIELLNKVGITVEQININNKTIKKIDY